VVTAPDKPRGRGQQLSPTPIKELALKHHLPILQPNLLKDSSFIGEMERLHPDLIVVVAFRILPREVFAIPRLGAFNLHASLLPKFRGAAPINWAIINGERETGVTTFFLQDRVDTGNMILQARTPIKVEDDAGTLHDRLAEIGAEMVLHTVRLIERGKAVPRKQDDSLATPAPKIFKEDCRINWNQSAERIHNFVRGLSPYPTAFTMHEGKVIKMFRTRVLDEIARGEVGAIEVHGSAYGSVGGFRVCCADTMIAVDELQLEGRKRMGAEEFLRGYDLASGERFV
jgi:methionyl-tRNA formyltransferase